MPPATEAQRAEGEGVESERSAPSPARNSDTGAELAVRDGDLLAIERVADALERCVTFDEFRGVLDTAALLQGLFRQRKASLLSQNRLAEVRLRTERRLGEILLSLKIRRGRKNSADPANVNPALADIQVSERESSVWKRLAGLDAEAWERRIAEANENGIELRTAWMLKGPPPAEMRRAQSLADQAEAAQDAETMSDQDAEAAGVKVRRAAFTCAVSFLPALVKHLEAALATARRREGEAP